MESVIKSALKDLDRKYADLYPWYVNSLEPFCRLNTDQSLTLDGSHCPITPLPEFDGHAFWADCYETEKKKILSRQENYFCKSRGYDITDKHFWIGINPVPIQKKEKNFKMINLYTIFKNSSVIKKWNYEAVIEAYTDEGYRPHMHMILFSPLHHPNRIIKTLSKLFQCDPNFIDCKTDYKLQIHKNYIRGNKTETKLGHIHDDNQERIEYNIPHLLSSS